MPSYLGKYRGLVTDNRAPEHRGRLKAKCPLVFGEEVLDWALPCVPFGGNAGMGFYAIPPVGSGVWLEFEQGDVNRPVWVGTWWAAPKGHTEAPDAAVNAEEMSAGGWDDPGVGETPRSSPTNHVFATPSGHRIELDDAPGATKLTFTDRLGQSILLRSEPGQEKIHLKDASGNRVSLEGAPGQRRIVLYDGAGSSVVMDAEQGDVAIMAVRNLKLAAGEGLYIGAKEDLELHLGNNARLQALGNLTIQATGSTTVDAVGSLTLGQMAATVRVAGGGPPVARVGDTVNLTTGVITSGSSKVVSG